MTKKIDFVAKRKKLHNEILKEIVKIMKDSSCRMIEFPNKGKVRPKVLRCLDKIDTYELVEVKSIRLHGRCINYKAFCSPKSQKSENDWWSLKKNIAHTYITDIYDAVIYYFDKIA